jgi:hypothetical protein
MNEQTAMRILLLLSACVVAAIAGAADTAVKCGDSCKIICLKHNSGESNACMATCVKTCSKSAPTFFGKPYLATVYAFSMPGDTEITGSDSPSKPPNSDTYFTTRDGRLYRYESTRRELTLLFTLEPEELDQRGNKGLYSVAFNRNFNTNGLLYLHYSAPANASAPESSILVENVNANPDLLAYLVVEHYNIILQLRSYSYDDVRRDTPTRMLQKHSQFSADRSGGWMKAGVRHPMHPSNTSTLLYALGGNAEHASLLVKHGQHLSMIHSMIPESQNRVEEMWSSGIRNPLSCASSVLKIDYIYCLVEDSVNTRTLYQLKRGVNYGSPNYQHLCNGAACEGKRQPLLGLTGLLNFSRTDECPVRSIVLYTGHEMTRFKAHLFLSRDACYLPSKGTLNPTEILHLAYSSITGLWTTKPISTKFYDNLIVNTTILGGDLHDDWFLAGNSLRTGEMLIQRIEARKAGDLDF